VKPPDFDMTLSRVSEVPEELVTQCVGHDTEADDMLPWRTADPWVIVEQPVGGSSDSVSLRAHIWMTWASEFLF